MNAMELKYRGTGNAGLTQAMDQNEQKFRQQRRNRDEARGPGDGEDAFQALMETERERRVITEELHRRRIPVPLGDRGRSQAIHLKRRRARPGLPQGGPKLPIVGYREIRGRREDILTVTAVITVAEEGVWRSDIMVLPGSAAAEIQAGLTGEDPVRVLNRMYRERKETGNRPCRK